MIQVTKDSEERAARIEKAREERRFRVVNFSAELLAAMLGNRRRFWCYGMPEEYGVLNCSWDWQSNSIAISIASPEFDPVEPGVVPDRLEVWAESVETP